MKHTIIKQFIRLEKMLQVAGYEMLPKYNAMRNELIIIIPLKGDNGKDIMSQWVDVRRVEGG